MNYRFSPEKRATNVGIQYHRLLNNDVKRTTKLDGMGPFKSSIKIFTLFALKMYIMLLLFCYAFVDNLKEILNYYNKCCFILFKIGYCFTHAIRIILLVLR